MAFEPQRFIHAANVRLDVPVSVQSVDALSDDLQTAFEDATLTSFDDVIQACLTYQVDFLLLSGNIFIEADRSLRARLALLNGFETLAEDGIPVYVLPGDADPPEAWRAIPEMPANVQICFSSSPEPLEVVREDRVIATVSAAMWYGETDAFGIRVITESENGVQPFRIASVSQAKYEESRRMAAMAAESTDDLLDTTLQDAALAEERAARQQTHGTLVPLSGKPRRAVQDLLDGHLPDARTEARNAPADNDEADDDEDRDDEDRDDEDREEIGQDELEDADELPAEGDGVTDTVAHSRPSRSDEGDELEAAADDAELEDEADGSDAERSEWDDGFIVFVDEILREGRLNYLALTGELQRATLTRPLGTLHCPGTTQPRNHLETAEGCCSLIEIGEDGLQRIRPVDTSSVDWKFIEIQVARQTTLSGMLQTMKTRLMQQELGPSDRIWSVHWTLRCSLAELRELIQDDLTVAAAIELDELKRGNRTIRLLHNFRLVPNAWHLPDAQHLAQRYAVLTGDPELLQEAGLQSRVAEDPELTVGWRHRLNALIEGIDPEQILARLRADGAEWFLPDLSILEADEPADDHEERGEFEQAAALRDSSGRERSSRDVADDDEDEEEDSLFDDDENDEDDDLDADDPDADAPDPDGDADNDSGRVKGGPA